MRLQLLRHEEALGNPHSLQLRVAGELDDLHPVAKRRRDRVEHVRRGDEQHLGQVERHLQVVVLEAVVLLRVEDLEQRRRRVAAEVHADLVDLVEHEHRVRAAGGLDVLDHAAGKRADVRAPMAADLRLVVDAAQAHAHELAAHGAGDALAEARLADAGRSDEEEDRRADLLGQLAHGHVLDDALLRLLEAPVVLVEDLLGLVEVEVVIGLDAPRQADEPVDVGANDALLRAGARDPRESIDFLEGLLLDLVGHRRLLDLLAQLGRLGDGRVVLPQLLLDRLHLLAQDVLALGLVHLGLDLGLDAALQLEHLDLLGKEGRCQPQPIGDVDRLEQLLSLLGRHLRAVGGHVGQQAAVDDVARGDRHLRRNRCAAVDVLLDLAVDRGHQRLDLEGLVGLILDELDPSLEVRVGLDEVEQPDPALALDDRADRPVLEADHLGDLRQRADRVELVDAGDLVLLARALGDEGHRLRGADGAVERLDAAIAAHGERHDHFREDHGVTERNEWHDLHAVERRAVLLVVRRVDLRDVLGLVFVLSCHVGLLLRRALARRTHRLRGSCRRIARHRLHRTGRRPGSSRVPRAEG